MSRTIDPNSLRNKLRTGVFKDMTVREISAKEGYKNNSIRSATFELIHKEGLKPEAMFTYERGLKRDLSKGLYKDKTVNQIEGYTPQAVYHALKYLERDGYKREDLLKKDASLAEELRSHKYKNLTAQQIAELKGVDKNTVYATISKLALDGGYKREDLYKKERNGYEKRTKSR